MLDKLQKALHNKKTYIILYVLFLAISILYVRSVLKNIKVDVNQKTTQKDTFEVKPVSVELIIKAPGINNNYKLNLKNTDTVLNLIDEIRKTKGLKYEKTEYAYGTEITSVQNVSKDLTNRWMVWSKSPDGTVSKVENFNKQKLVNDTKYLLIYRSIDATELPEL